VREESTVQLKKQTEEEREILSLLLSSISKLHILHFLSLSHVSTTHTHCFQKG